MSTYLIGGFQMITIIGRPGKDQKVIADISRNGVDNHGTKEMATKSNEMTVQCVVDAATEVAAVALENSYAAAVGDFESVTINGVVLGTYEIKGWNVNSIIKGDPACGGLADGEYLVRSTCRLWRRGA